MRILFAFLLLTAMAYADSTSVIFHHNVTDAGEEAVVDSVVYHQIYYLEDSIGAATHIGPNTGAFWDTVKVDNVYLGGGLSAAITYHIGNSFGDTQYVLVNNVESEFSADTPSGPDTCVVYGNVEDIGGSASERATVTVLLKGSNIRDTCNNKLIVNYQKKVNSNSAGYWSMPLIKSKCFSPSKTYEIVIEWSTGRYEDRSLTVPDSVTYKVK